MSAHSDNVSTLSLSPNAEHVVSTGGREVGLWRFSDGAQLWLVPADKYEATAALVHPSGCVVSAGSFGTVAVLEGDSGRVRHTIELGEAAGGLFQLPDGRVAVGTDEYEDLFLLDVATGQRQDLEAQGEQGSSRGIRVEGNTLASLGLNAGIVRWNLDTLAFIGRVAAPAGECVGWLGNDRAVTLERGAIVVWQAADGAIAHRIEASEVKQVFPSPDGRHLLATTMTGVILLDGHTGAVVGTLELGFFPRFVRLVDGGAVAALGTWQSGRSELRLVALPSLKEVGSLDRSTVSAVVGVGRTLFFGGADDSVERATY